MSKTPARLLGIGTHHKTGTIWMRNLFRGAEERGLFPAMQIYREKRLEDIPPEGPVVLLNWHSTFPKPLLQNPEARFLHLIRDPRDILLSGMRYHQTALLRNEKFLRGKRPELGKKNYQEYLISLPTDFRKLMFEMEHKHDETVQEMLAWDQTNPNAREVKYEALIEDTDMSLFRSLLDDFDIQGLDKEELLKAYWDFSLFGNLKDPGELHEGHAGHVTSGSGKASQWREKMPRRVAEEYARRYGPALKALGYADSNDWVEETKVNP